MAYKNPLLLSVLQRIVSGTGWWLLATIYFFHFSITWVALHFCGETFASGIESLVEYIYWYGVSFSTVGYGDITLQTQSGRLLYALIINPIGLIIFSLLLTQLAGLYLKMKENITSGNISICGMSDHILIFGWIPNKTNKLVNMLQHRAKKVVIVSNDPNLEHPMLDEKVIFIRVADYISNEHLDLLGLSQSKSVVVNTGDDAMNHLTTVAIANKLDKTPQSTTHIVVYAEDNNVQNILENANERIEVINIHKEQLLSRSALFAGSSSCTEALINPKLTATQYTLTLPECVETMSFDELAIKMREMFDVIIIGISEEHDKLGRELCLNPSRDYIIEGGEHIHYIANQPINLSKKELEAQLCSQK